LKNEKLVLDADPIILIYFAGSAFSSKLAMPNTPSMREPGRIHIGALHFDSAGPQKETISRTITDHLKSNTLMKHH
jgi:hypothetical protein